MKPHSAGFVIGIVASLILGFGIVAGIALGLRSIGSLGYEPSVLQATKTGPNSATLTLATYPDSQVCHPNADAQKINWVTYCSGSTSDPTAQGSNLEVPPNSLITVIIKQYDSSTTLINDYFSQVHGTVGGVAYLNGKSYSKVSPDAPGHTFTIQSMPDNTTFPIFVSVPLVGVPDNANPNAVTIAGNPYPKPNIIEFQFHTGPAGITYIWHCYDPCGDQEGRNPPFGFSGPMSTTGYMAGQITVTSY